MQREQFVKAREYQQKWDDYRKAKADGKDATPPDVDLALEPLVEVLERKRTVHFHCHRADDLMTAVRLAEEFDFELVLQHATEGYRIADELARRKIPVSLTLVDSPGGKPEVAGPARRERRHPRQGRRQGRHQHRRLHHRIALLPAHRGHRRARRHVGGRRPQGADPARRRDAAPRRPPRLAGQGQGRRFRRAVRAAVQRLHAGAADLHRRRMRLRPLAAGTTGPTRPAASPCPTATACRRRRRW